LDTIQNTQDTSVELPKEPGFLTRLINIFVNPVKALESIDRQPTWFGPLLMIVIIALATAFIAMPFTMQAQIDLIRNNPNIPPEQAQMIERQMSQAGPIQYIGALIGVIIAMPLMIIIIAGLFYFVGSVILGGDSTFKKNFSIWVWASCISFLGAIIRLPLILIKKSAQVSLSPALFLPGDKLGTPLYAFFANFDFFTIWHIVVFAIGFSIIYKFSRAKAFMAVGFLWAVWIAISTIFASVFSRFGM
jgi:hypothetical protein